MAAIFIASIPGVSLSKASLDLTRTKQNTPGFYSKIKSEVIFTLNLNEVILHNPRFYKEMSLNKGT